MHDKRNFPRFLVREKVICSRYGRQMTMRTQNISLGGLKLEANFDLRVGEIMDFSILINGTGIHCKGMVVEVEEFGNKVHARLRFAPVSDSEYGKLLNYLYDLSRRPFLRGIVGDSVLFLWGTIRHAMMRAAKWIRGISKGRQEDKGLQQVNSWLELLPNRERTVISLRFGLSGGSTHTLESIGKSLGLTPEAVRQIEAETIEKLRRLSKKQEIYLEDILRIINKEGLVTKIKKLEGLMGR